MTKHIVEQGVPPHEAKLSRNDVTLSCFNSIFKSMPLNVIDNNIITKHVIPFQTFPFTRDR